MLCDHRCDPCCWLICFHVSKITKKRINGFWCDFQDMSKKLHVHNLDTPSTITNICDHLMAEVLCTLLFNPTCSVHVLLSNPKYSCWRIPFWIWEDIPNYHAITNSFSQESTLFSHTPYLPHAHVEWKPHCPQLRKVLSTSIVGCSTFRFIIWLALQSYIYIYIYIYICIYM